MREIGIEALRQIEIRLLKNVSHFCEEKGLRYFLTGGSLLGAIRHKGFIPWDDDIDIVMPREDYEIFVKTFCSEQDNYKVVSCYNQNDYYLPFAKVVDANTVLVEKLEHNSTIGVFLDVFPLDFFDFTERQINSFYWKQRKRIKLLSAKTSPLSKIQKNKRVLAAIMKGLCFAIPANMIAKSIDKHAKKFSCTKGRVACVAVAMTYGKKEFLNAMFFDEYLEVQFQDCVFRAPKGYDGVLRSYYGNYMELPPPNKRVTHHDFRAYYKEGY